MRNEDKPKIEVYWGLNIKKSKTDPKLSIETQLEKRGYVIICAIFIREKIHDVLWDGENIWIR